MQRLPTVRTANFRSAGTRGKGRVDKVDVVGHIGRTLPDNLARLGHHVFGPPRVKFGNRDDPDTVGLGKIPILAAIGGTTNADDDIAFGVDQAFLDSAAKRGAVVEARRTEIDVVQIGVAVELDQCQRLARGTTSGQRAQDRQAAQMVAAAGQRQNSRRANPGIKRLHPRHGVHQIARIGGDVAQIGAARKVERGHPGRAILRPDHRRGIAQLARSMARARPIGGTAVPRSPDQTDLDIGQTRIVQRHMRQSHERRDPGESRQIKARDRPKERILLVCHCISFRRAPAPFGGSNWRWPIQTLQPGPCWPTGDIETA